MTGEARFADDEYPAALWFGCTVRSPHPRARIGAISLDGSRAPRESVLLTAADLPGPNAVRLIDDDWPILAAEETRHCGEPVALVAAPTRLEALAARDAVEVAYEPLPAVFDIEEAETALPLLAESAVSCGDVESVLSDADRIFEGTYRCGHQEHLYIECQAVTASYGDDGRLEVHGTMQCPYYVHGSLCHALGLAPDQVRVRVSAVGGGFGGKEDFPSMLAVHAALLAGRCRHPVRMAYERHEDIVATTKRHPGLLRYRTAVDAAGRLLAMDIEVLLDGGAYTTLSPVVLSRAVLHATGPYRCDNVRVRGKAVRTNTATNGAFRGFGAPQSQYGIERHMDRTARGLGLDPYEIRRVNALRAGDRLATGQVLDDSTSALECLERVVRETDFQRRWRKAEKARSSRNERSGSSGLGVSLFFHGSGFTGLGERKMRSPATVRLISDGSIEVLTSMVDMGQGCLSIFPQMAMEASGLGEGDVVLAEVDTDQVPDSGPTVASRTTMVVGSCVVEAVRRATARVLAWAAANLETSEDLSVREGLVEGLVGGSRGFRQIAARYFEQEGALEVTVRYQPPEWQEFDEETYRGAAYPAYSWGANVVEVEADIDTLQVQPKTVTAACEVGRVVHRTQCRGQIEGGTLQAVGWALLEEIKLENGRYLNDRLATYIIPTFKDSPRIDVELLEKPSRVGPFGAKGVGELPMDGPAPAIAGAIENALGLEVNDIPATPERLLAARPLDEEPR